MFKSAIFLLFRGDPFGALTRPKMRWRCRATLARLKALNAREELRIRLEETRFTCSSCSIRFYTIDIAALIQRPSRKKELSFEWNELFFIEACLRCGVLMYEGQDEKFCDLFKVLEKLEEQYAPTRVSAGLLHSAEQRVERRRLEIALAEERHREAVAELEKLHELPLEAKNYRVPALPTSTPQ